MGQQLHGGLVEEDPQVCPPCKGTPVVLLRTHPGPCGGTCREPEVVAAVEDGSGLVLHASSRGSAALGSKKVVTSGSLSGFSGSLSSPAFLFKFR